MKFLLTREILNEYVQMALNHRKGYVVRAVISIVSFLLAVILCVCGLFPVAAFFFILFLFYVKYCFRSLKNKKVKTAADRFHIEIEIARCIEARDEADPDTDRCGFVFTNGEFGWVGDFPYNVDNLMVGKCAYFIYLTDDQSNKLVPIANYNNTGLADNFNTNDKVTIIQKWYPEYKFGNDTANNVFFFTDDWDISADLLPYVRGTVEDPVYTEKSKKAAMKQIKRKNRKMKRRNTKSH